MDFRVVPLTSDRCQIMGWCQCGQLCLTVVEREAQPSLQVCSCGRTIVAGDPAISHLQSYLDEARPNKQHEVALTYVVAPWGDVPLAYAVPRP
jgi:hypothetical protein